MNGMEFVGNNIAACKVSNVATFYYRFPIKTINNQFFAGQVGPLVGLQFAKANRAYFGQLVRFNVRPAMLGPVLGIGQGLDLKPNDQKNTDYLVGAFVSALVVEISDRANDACTVKLFHEGTIIRTFDEGMPDEEKVNNKTVTWFSDFKKLPLLKGREGKLFNRAVVAVFLQTALASKKQVSFLRDGKQRLYPPHDSRADGALKVVIIDRLTKQKLKEYWLDSKIEVDRKGNMNPEN